MIKAILGLKVEQAQTFISDGRRMAVTNVITNPCYLVDIKTEEKDGYQALVLGLGVKRIKNIAKAQMGIFKKAGLDKNPPRFLKEIIIKDGNSLNDEVKVGQKINLSQVFQEGDVVNVQGISKGKGFAGVVKRYKFKGGPRTHGQSDRERAPGSIGQTTTPGRVYKGKRMAGRMGNKLVTIKNLKIVHLDNEKGVLTISGLVPGGRNSLLIIQKT